MFKLTKLALIGSLFTVLSFQVFAVDNRTSGTSSNNAPSADCSKVRLCVFSDLKDKETGQAAYYYCVPPVEATSFTMENHAVIITGFNADGILKGFAGDLNKYSFGAYRDSNRAFFPVVSIVDQNNNPIACYPGQGNRPVHPGAPRF